MEKDFEIEILNEEIKKEESVQLPINFISFGEIEFDDTRVYIRQDVYKQLETYARKDTNNERGTILLGDYFEEQGKQYVIVSDYIEARYTDASASTLTFTHKTWDYVHKEHEEKYSDKKIIGWQHTHPSYGIFLSNYDLFIHENFFNLPFQIAYVIDPIQNLRGFFQWKNGKIEKLTGYYVYDEVGVPIKLDEEKKKEKNIDEAKPVARSNKLLSTLTIILCIALIFISFREHSLQKQIEDQNKEINKLISQVEEGRNSGDTADVSKDSIEFIYHVVKAGETLYGICKKEKINYNDSINAIISLNGLDSPNHIEIGQKILLPKM